MLVVSFVGVAGFVWLCEHVGPPCDLYTGLLLFGIVVDTFSLGLTLLLGLTLGKGLSLVYQVIIVSTSFTFSSLVDQIIASVGFDKRDSDFVCTLRPCN